MIRSWMHAAFGIFVCAFLPVLLASGLPPEGTMFVAVLNGVLLLVVWTQCSSKSLSFPGGMDVIAESWMSGCVNLTLLYLPFLLFGVYVAAIRYGILGLAGNRAAAQEGWRSIVEFTSGGPVRKPNRFAHHTGLFHPDNLDFSRSDPESMLHAAGMLDQHGEWSEAIALYEDAIRRWPEDYGEYARNCIASIEKKQTLG